MKEKIQLRNENKITFPKYIKIINEGSSVQITPPETYCRFPKSKNLQINHSGDHFVEYSFKDVNSIPRIKSKMTEKRNEDNFREYHKYTRAKGYR